MAVKYLWHQYLCNNSIRIKYDFLCINICWAPREVLKPEPERRGFQHLQMLMYQKIMFDSYYCIKKNSARKLWTNCSKSSFYLYLYILTDKRNATTKIRRCFIQAVISSNYVEINQQKLLAVSCFEGILKFVQRTIKLA